MLLIKLTYLLMCRVVNNFVWQLEKKAALAPAGLSQTTYSMHWSFAYDLIFTNLVSHGDEIRSLPTTQLIIYFVERATATCFDLLSSPK